VGRRDLDRYRVPARGAGPGGPGVSHTAAVVPAHIGGGRRHRRAGGDRGVLHRSPGMGSAAAGRGRSRADAGAALRAGRVAGTGLPGDRARGVGGDARVRRASDDRRRGDRPVHPGVPPAGRGGRRRGPAHPGVPAVAEPAVRARGAVEHRAVGVGQRTAADPVPTVVELRHRPDLRPGQRRGRTRPCGPRRPHR
jgi:hypothetical protein